MTEPVGIAFIGAGAVSKWHAAAVAACPVAQLVGLCDADQTQAASAARDYRCAHYDGIDELLADPHVQAVAILSPVDLHHAHTLQALAAGKHVLIEKPVASSVAEVRDIELVAQGSGLACMPAHNYVYAPAIQRTRHLIETGAFGRIVSAWVIYNLHHPRDVAAKYPGVLRQITTHHFYSLLHLLGKPRRLTALAAESRPPAERLDREDQVAIVAEMPSGALVNLFASFAADDQTADPWTVLFKVLGTEGGSVYSWRDAIVLSSGAGLAWRYPAYEESFTYEVDYFIRRCILGRDQPRSTISDAATTQELVEAAEEAIRSGRVVDL